MSENDASKYFNHEERRVERRRAAVQVSDFRCIRPFGLRGKWPPDHQHVSSSLSKIPYSGFSPVRLQTGFQPRPSSTMASLSARPAFPHPWRIYTRLKSLSPKRATASVLGLASNRDSLLLTETIQSRGPWLPSGLCCPAGSSLTITSCELLVPSRQFMDYPAGPCPTV